MLRWEPVKTQYVHGTSTKMYRPLHKPLRTIKIKNEGLDFDHVASNIFNSPLLMYKILDANMVRYIEERGDVKRLKEIIIPIGTQDA